jgi:hypothetical protein
VSGSKVEDDMEQLKKKTRELEVVAAMCKVNPDDVIGDMSDSMETANKRAKSLYPKDKTTDPYLQWWDVFFKEWSHKCFVKWINKFGDTKDYELMKNSWYIFEILWVVGCDMVRITRLNELRESISGVIARESPSEDDEGAIWQWINSYDETALKAIDLFKGKQRQAFAQVLEELREYDKASLLGKLKRLMSTYL